MAKFGDTLKVYLREVDDFSNPEVVVIVAYTPQEVEEMYHVLNLLGHENMVVKIEDADEAERNIHRMYVLRPWVYQRHLVEEPEYPWLVQSGPQAADGEYLRVFLTVQARSFLPHGNLVDLPEVVVIVAASREEATQIFEAIDKDPEMYVRTTRRNRQSLGDWIEVDTSIRQAFILRPPGRADFI
jgi:hypothetical protein